MILQWNNCLFLALPIYNMAEFAICHDIGMHPWYMLAMHMLRIQSCILAGQFIIILFLIPSWPIALQSNSAPECYHSGVYHSGVHHSGGHHSGVHHSGAHHSGAHHSRAHHSGLLSAIALVCCCSWALSLLSPVALEPCRYGALSLLSPIAPKLWSPVALES